MPWAALLTSSFAKILMAFEANGAFGHTAGANDSSMDLSWGKSWERGSISLIGNYQDRGVLLGQSAPQFQNRPIFHAKRAYVLYLADDCSPGNVYSLNGQNLPGLSSPQAGIPEGHLRNPHNTSSLRQRRGS